MARLTSRRKKKLREKFGNKCQKCGEIKRLQFHHNESVIKGGNNVQENLQLLCKKCHREIHKKDPEKYKVTREGYLKSRMVINKGINNFYRNINNIWLPEKVGWHQWRLELEHRYRRFFFTNEDYYTKILKEKHPKTVFYSTIQHLDPREYRSQYENLPGYEPVIIGGLICFDFDSDGTEEGLDEAKIATYKFWNFLRTTQRDIQEQCIIFSGSKGFHIVCKDPMKLPEDPKKRRKAMKDNRKLYIEGLVKDYGSCPFDRPIAEDIYRFIRAPGTVNKKTGYIASIIDEELLKLPIQEFLDNVPHVCEERPEILCRKEMTISPSDRRKGDGKRPGQSFHLQTFLTNKVVGLKDRGIPIFMYKQHTFREIDGVLRSLIRTYSLSDIYLFKDASATYAMCLKTFQKERLNKIMQASHADNRTHKVLRMPFSNRVTEDGVLVDKRPEFIGKITGIDKASFVSSTHLAYLQDFHGIDDEYQNIHGDSEEFRVTNSRIQVE